MVSEMFHCVKNQGTSRIFYCVRGVFGFTVKTGKLSSLFAPVTVFTSKATLKTYFSNWQNGTWSLDHPEEMKLIAAQLIDGDEPSVPIAGETTTYRIKTGVYTERQSEGFQTTITQTALDKFDDWLDGIWSVDLPDADEREVYRDRPFDGVAI